MRKYNILIALFLCIGISSCYITRAYKYRKFLLKDVEKFDTALLQPSANPFQFINGIGKYKNLTNFLDTTLPSTKTYSFLVIKNDSIIYEKYFNNLEPASKLPSFSVAKSFVSTLVAIAQEEGYIKSLQDPITQYIPELKNNNAAFEQITVQHVLDMRSGIKSNEDYYNPFSDVLKLGFTKNITAKLMRLQIQKATGTNDYISVNTQILALIIERATQKKLQQYLQEKIWNPLGMEYAATWNIDSKKHHTVRAFCCLNAATKDFAKLGRLYQQKGKWNGKQILSENWVNNTTNPDTMLSYGGYRNQWWSMEKRQYFTDSLKAFHFATITPHNSGLKSYVDKKTDSTRYYITYLTKGFHAEGILGQFIYVEPTKNIIIVRTGYYWQHKKYSAENFLYALGNSF